MGHNVNTKEKEILTNLWQFQTREKKVTQTSILDILSGTTEGWQAQSIHSILKYVALKIGQDQLGMHWLLGLVVNPGDWMTLKTSTIRQG